MSAPYEDVGGSSDAGAVYVFEESSGTWSQSARIQAASVAAGDHFGLAIDVCGTRIIVGAPDADTSGSDSGRTSVFTLSSGTWTSTKTFSPGTSGQKTGSSVAIGVDVLAIGIPDYSVAAGGCSTNCEVGRVLTYYYDSGIPDWQSRATLSPVTSTQGGNFGQGIAIDGTRLIVSEYGRSDRGSDIGAWYLFDISSSSSDWLGVFSVYDAQPNDRLGRRSSGVAIEGDNLVVGAHGVDSDRGAAYMFRRESITGRWSETLRLRATGGGAGDNLGYAVAISGTLVAVGCEDDDSARGALFLFGVAGCSGSDCPADVNGDRIVNSTDVSDYINLYFLSSPDCPP